jgi:NAD-dependent dihydropyrimidine dehydrogenase PreA subunit
LHEKNQIYFLAINQINQEEEMSVVIDKETCVGCAACIDTCPVEALEMVDDKAVVNEEACVDCGACIDACPVGSITL